MVEDNLNAWPYLRRRRMAFEDRRFRAKGGGAVRGADAKRCVSRADALRLAGLACASGACAWLASGLAGCGEAASEGYQGPTLTPGTLTIISSINWPPFVISEDGADKGLGVSVCNTIGEELGLDLDALSCETDAEVYSALSAGKADLGGVIAREDEVPEGFAPSESIMPCNISLVSKGELRENDLGDLDVPETQILAIDHPVVREWIESTFTDLKVTYKEDPLAILNAVRAGTVPFCVLTRPEALYYLNSVYTTLTEGMLVVTGERFTFVTLEENRELIDAVDGVIVGLEDSGEIASLEAMWFGTQLMSD